MTSTPFLDHFTSIVLYAGISAPPCRNAPLRAFNFVSLSEVFMQKGFYPVKKFTPPPPDSENYLAGSLYKNTADYYDYDNRKIIKDDLDFYVEYANKTNGTILELASGTGRVSLYVAEKTSRHIQCIELSEYMVKRFKHKLKTTHRHLRDRINICVDDMSCFDLGKKFEFIIIPWRALQWLPVQEKTLEYLNGFLNI
jgi:SAM-dependent methyltransferase